MKVKIPKIDIRKELAGIPPIRSSRLVDYWFIGDSVATDFKLPRRFKPYSVFNDGLRVKEGLADQYTVKFDGFSHIIVFLIAPANGADICIDGVYEYEN